MINHSNLDKAYFSLINDCCECVNLANWIASNSNYKEEIRTATDPLVVDCCREAYRLMQTLREVIQRQKDVNNTTMASGRKK